jgi:hypothetical protein
VEEMKVKKLKVKKNSMKVQQKINHKKRRCTAAKRKEKSLFQTPKYQLQMKKLKMMM